MGQVMRAEPALAFWSCHSLAFLSSSGSSLRARKLCLSSLLRVALASSQARISLRKAASSGVSLKSMGSSVRRLGRVLLFETTDQLFLPPHRPAALQRPA